MLMTTTPSIEGKHIVHYHGVMSGEVILGANFLKDMFAGIRDFVGGRSGTYEKELERARTIAMQELQQKAQDMGANAIVGIDIDYQVLGKDNGMLMVSATGTAVTIN
ncbi:heavy metal-binding domain-containing protein [Vibrio rarus]|uniref:heavy metal-binding domain-containing protein n=1 Tax=Vibrio rarus TaxID=413403 RepID=UPI0021C2F896|nr:heavy metal-binding domain-containing protein [Vibrio rarus]